MITTSCPAAASLTSILQARCAEDFGQIQKVIFQRLSGPGVTHNILTTATSSGGGSSIMLLADMQTLLAATDSTKIVVSPYVESPAVEAGDARTSGGGNDSLNGIETLVGTNPTTFTAQIRSQKQSVIKQMKALMGESKAHNLGVYLINENGQIAGLDAVLEYGGSGSPGSAICPIPAELLFVGDKAFGGFEAPDSNTLSWSFRPNYSDNLFIVKPTNYNPLTDLDQFES